MLGVRRASVSEVAAKLQKAGLIDYHRGKMKIVDRKGLEALDLVNVIGLSNKNTSVY